MASNLDWSGLQPSIKRQELESTSKSEDMDHGMEMVCPVWVGDELVPQMEELSIVCRRAW